MKISGKLDWYRNYCVEFDGLYFIHHTQDEEYENEKVLLKRPP